MSKWGNGYNDLFTILPLVTASGTLVTIPKIARELYLMNTQYDGGQAKEDGYNACTVSIDLFTSGKMYLIYSFQTGGYHASAVYQGVDGNGDYSFKINLNSVRAFVGWR